MPNQSAIKNVADTAFLTACSRSRHPKLSGDTIADFWIPESAWPIHHDYIVKSPPYEEILISLRNRFFLDDIRKYFGNKQGQLVIPGSGMTSMSFLVPDTIHSAEIDVAPIINLKRNLVALGFANGRLPNRNISFVECDFNAELTPCSTLFQNGLKSSVKTYALLEGLIYYLRPDVTRGLLRWLSEHFVGELRVGLTYWDNKMSTNPFLVQYQEFLKQTGMDHRIFFTSAEDLIAAIPQSQPICQTDYIEIASQMQIPSPPKSNDAIFGEDFLILDRTATTKCNL